MRFEELHVGQRAEIRHTVTDADIATFGALTGDRNPVHFDDTFAESTRFGGRIGHGLLTASFISTVVGMHLPGTGAIYASQSLRFLLPVRPGDTIRVAAEVVALDPERHRVRLRTAVRNQRDEVVLDGEAEMVILARRA